MSVKVCFWLRLSHTKRWKRCLKACASYFSQMSADFPAEGMMKNLPAYFLSMRN